MPKIQLTESDASYRITLDAPPLHILDMAMLGELRGALAGVGSDRHLLIIDSTGPLVFSAGVSVHDHLADRVGEMLQTFHDCFRSLAALDLVTIALVRGPALGGGCELAISCDFVLATEEATFGTPEVTLGVFPPVASLQLPRQIAPRRALEMVLCGDPIDAASALEAGLVNAVYPAADFERGCKEWMTRLTRHSASSLRIAKRAFRLAQAADFENRLAAVEKLYLEELIKTADAHEGIAAFIEKRPPVWRG